MIFEKRRLELAGKRVKIQGEMLHAIRIVKFYGNIVPPLHPARSACALTVPCPPPTAWEESFLGRIFKTRLTETNLLLKCVVVAVTHGSCNGTQLTPLLPCCPLRYNFVRSTIVMMFMTLPLLVSLVTFGVYIAAGNVLDAPTVFKSLALFNALR